MRLKELLSGYELPEKMRNREIDRICTSIKENLRGALFVCLAGSKDDGHRYAAQAAAQGAVVLCERDCNVSDAIRCSGYKGGVCALLRGVVSKSQR